MPSDSRCQAGFGIQSTEECKSASEDLGLSVDKFGMSSGYSESASSWLPSGCNRVEPPNPRHPRMTIWNTAASVKTDRDSKPICKIKATVCAVNQKVVGNACVECPVGKTSPGNHDASGGDTTCEATTRHAMLLY
jgi:hypothetical protein